MVDSLNFIGRLKMKTFKYWICFPEEFIIRKQFVVVGRYFLLEIEHNLCLRRVTMSPGVSGSVPVYLIVCSCQWFVSRLEAFRKWSIITDWGKTASMGLITSILYWLNFFHSLCWEHVSRHVHWIKFSYSWFRRQSWIIISMCLLALFLEWSMFVEELPFKENSWQYYEPVV